MAKEQLKTFTAKAPRPPREAKPEIGFLGALGAPVERVLKGILAVHFCLNTMKV
jgi:hypothetical protein